MNWQQLEDMVRYAAEAKFSGTARAETIAGVKCDCVIHLSDGSVVLVEVSKESTIDKLRIDLAKFNTLRPHFISENIFPRCFFVTLNAPTPSLIEAGKAHRVQVFSVYQFLDWIFALKQYLHLRSRQAFGSAIDLYSGEPDKGEYIPVEYVTDSGEVYRVQDIVRELSRNKVVVLMGDFGEGKSRCAKEIFSLLQEDESSRYSLPLAINLRENWGLKRASELINRHFDDLGLGTYVPDLMKVAFSPGTIYLLDGFDEIGAQTWSDDPTKLVDIRKHSLSAVHDLINRAKGGVLVTGREHYFNNDAELLECLGVAKRSFVLLRCQSALTGDQFARMIDVSGLGTSQIPDWVPRKPLIAKIISEIEPAVRDRIFETGTGQVDFWDLLIETLCEREARISTTLDPAIIRSLYERIGRLCRTTSTSLGPLSIKSIYDAFEATTGRPPTDESALILQRLPGLGRIGAESLDRRFVDEYILDGLKAEDTLQIYSQAESAVLREEWKHPIGDFGCFYIATRISSTKQVAGLLAFLKRHRDVTNRVLISDMLSALYRFDEETFDFGGITVKGGRFGHLNLSEGNVKGLHFEDCYFDSVDITDAEPRDVVLRDSAIARISGVTSSQNLPDWIQNCIIGDFQNVQTLVAIRKASLSTSQTFLLTSLRKLFLQPGSGRRRSSMFKGYADLNTKKICEKVITILKREKFCSEHQGATEELYIPNRAMTARAKAMLNQLTQSKDDIWQQVSKIERG